MFDIAAYLTSNYSNMPAIQSVVNLLLQPPERRGIGTITGLMEAAVDPNIENVCGVDTEVRYFCRVTTQVNYLLDHGAHSASLLAAHGWGGYFGLVPNTRLLIASLADSHGNIDPENAVQSIEWFVDEGVDIVAIPLGDSSASKPLARAIDEAIKKGIIIFAASGNIFPNPVTFPARFPGVLAVGASDPQGNICLECCRSPHLDFILPGTDIPALSAEGEIEPRSGSSVACVIAAGLAALLSSASASRAKFQHLIKEFAQPKGGCDA